MNKKDIRNLFRNGVFKRDNYTCKVCKQKREEGELDAHHITDRNLMPSGGYVLSNGITVCKRHCHFMVEMYHSSHGDTWQEGYHPDDLYKLINSSKEKALDDSSKL